MPLLIVSDVEPDEFLEIAFGVENLNAPVTAVSRVDVSLPVDLHVVRISKLARAGSVGPPRLDPVAILVHLGDARIDVAVAEIYVVFRIPRHIGWPVIESIDSPLFGRRGSLELEAFISLRPPPEIHEDVPGRIELHDRIRSFIDDP